MSIKRGKINSFNLFKLQALFQKSSLYNNINFDYFILKPAQHTIHSSRRKLKESIKKNQSDAKYLN